LWQFRLAHAKARVAARRGKRQDAAKYVAEAKTALESMAELRKAQEVYFPYLTGYVTLYLGDHAQALAEFQEANQGDAFIQCLTAQRMEYLVGTILALAVAGFVTRIGLDRDRCFYPTVLLPIIIAAYYALFAVMGGTTGTIEIESAVGARYLILAWIGFHRNIWLIAAALAGHGVFDLVHRWFIANPASPVVARLFGSIGSGPGIGQKPL